jgi:four helix bundle protein
MNKAEELKERTARFATDIVTLRRALPPTREANRIANQLLDAATSSAANYRAVCRARSRAEFVAKMGTVVEETDEAAFWLEMLIRTEIMSARALKALCGEAGELTSIFAASLRTAKSRFPQSGDRGLRKPGVSGGGEPTR